MKWRGEGAERWRRGGNEDVEVGEEGRAEERSQWCNAVLGTPPQTHARFLLHLWGSFASKPKNLLILVMSQIKCETLISGIVVRVYLCV